MRVQSIPVKSIRCTWVESTPACMPRRACAPRACAGAPRPAPRRCLRRRLGRARPGRPGGGMTRARTRRSAVWALLRLPGGAARAPRPRGSPGRSRHRQGRHPGPRWPTWRTGPPSGGSCISCMVHTRISDTELWDGAACKRQRQRRAAAAPADQPKPRGMPDYGTDPDQTQLLLFQGLPDDPGQGAAGRHVRMQSLSQPCVGLASPKIRSRWAGREGADQRTPPAIHALPPPRPCSPTPSSPSLLDSAMGNAPPLQACAAPASCRPLPCAPWSGNR